MALASLASSCPPSDPIFPDPGDFLFETTIASAPPTQDIRVVDELNTFRKTQAELEDPTDLVAINRAARTIEILLPRPVALDTFDFTDVLILDSRFGFDIALARPLSEYVNTTDPDSVRFTRTRFDPLAGEGDCDPTVLPPDDDKSCDTLELVIDPGAIPTDVSVYIGLPKGSIDLFDEDCNRLPLEDALILGLSVRAEDPVDVPKLESYTLRPAGQGGDFFGLLELGVCTDCLFAEAPNGPLTPWPTAWYFPPHGRIRARFGAPPARLNVHAEIDELVFNSPRDRDPASANQLAVLGPTGAPFHQRVDDEIEFTHVDALFNRIPWEIGTKFHSFEIVSDDLFFQLGDPERFFLGAPTQSETGVGFVQTVGTDGSLPTTSITNFTIAHVRVLGIDDGATIVVEPDATTIAFPLEIVIDFENPARTVRDVTLFARDAGDPSAEPVEIPSTIWFGALLTSELCNLVAWTGDTVLFFRAFNESGHPLGSDRVTVKLACPIPPGWDRVFIADIDHTAFPWPWPRAEVVDGGQRRFAVAYVERVFSDPYGTYRYRFYDIDTGLQGTSILLAPDGASRIRAMANGPVVVSSCPGGGSSTRNFVAFDRFSTFLDQSFVFLHQLDWSCSGTPTSDSRLIGQGVVPAAALGVRSATDQKILVVYARDNELFAQFTLVDGTKTGSEFLIASTYDEDPLDPDFGPFKFFTTDVIYNNVSDRWIVGYGVVHVFGDLHKPSEMWNVRISWDGAPEIPIQRSTMPHQSQGRVARTEIAYDPRSATNPSGNYLWHFYEDAGVFPTPREAWLIDSDGNPTGGFADGLVGVRPKLAVRQDPTDLFPGQYVGFTIGDSDEDPLAQAALGFSVESTDASSTVMEPGILDGFGLATRAVGTLDGETVYVAQVCDLNGDFTDCGLYLGVSEH